ncbi:MAG TPA: OmpH family outer membrane protein [Saprospiraceae bacterium]|nr:OmpH family outer membrane protein [Saprospiraceae bacterium]HNH67431.1 OmpH family outer membrane protein [Bacteroidia bacterium]MCC6688747.1 OmpH family outer membrane protein [Saprospiraceae bacterium]HMV23007.1 OmpH family outer membrane protein [Saprospiraceae bacterium]HMW74049.1 OmpH family outer membrane protein [Saprospiraceae bacterium]
MKRITGLLVFSLILMGTQLVQAQKFGFVNSAALLTELPEVKAADSELNVLQNQLKKKGEEMVTAFQQKYAELATKEKNGEYSPKQLEMESQKLKDDEAKITQFEQESTQAMSKKREELLQPILDKVNKAINDVAKESGYAYVFDASTNVLLYADPSADVTALVKKKLGL